MRKRKKLRNFIAAAFIAFILMDLQLDINFISLLTTNLNIKKTLNSFSIIFLLGLIVLPPFISITTRPQLDCY